MLFVYLCSFFWSHVFFWVTCDFFWVTCVAISHISHMCCKTKGKIYTAVSESTKTFKLYFTDLQNLCHICQILEICRKIGFELQKAPFEGFAKGPHLKVVKGLGQCRPGTLYDIWWAECTSISNSCGGDNILY